MNQRDDEHDPLDLPLGPEREEAPDEQSWSGAPEDWGERIEEPGRGEPEPPPPHRRWPFVLLAVLALLVLLALAGVVGYLLPRPGPPILRLDTPLMDFEAVRVGDTSPARELTLESTGERPVRIGDMALTGPAVDAFEIAADGCSGTSLAPGRSCTVVLRFSPRSAAAVRATLDVPAEASNGPLSVALTGQGVAPEPVVDRRRIGFAPVAVGEASRAELLTLGNRGAAPLDVEGMAVEGPGARDFRLDGDRCTGESLGPGEECTVRVVFAPEAERERRATLRFRLGGSGDGPSRLEVDLAGVGLGAGPGAPGASDPGEEPAPPPPPELAAEPGSVDFGEVPVGGEDSGEVALRNSGGSPARLEALSLAGPDAPSFVLRDDRCGGRELAAGERCTVGVAFRPRQEGVLQARLGFASPDLPEGGTPIRVALRGAGAVGRLTLSARELDFGEVQAGASEERRLRLGNAGRAPVEVRELGLRGTVAGEFTVTSNGCPETVPLAPGERCEVTLRFAPAREGARTAELEVRHGGTEGGAEVRLLGVGLPAPAPRAEVSPAAVRFGAVRVSGRSDIETVTLVNRGSARMAVGEPRLEGPDADAFQIVPGSCAGASYLVPGSDCTVGVRFSPRAPGERRARLALPHDAEGRRSVVELVGTTEP